MPTNTLRCYRCDDWHDLDLGRTHAHGGRSLILTRLAARKPRNAARTAPPRSWPLDTMAPEHGLSGHGRWRLQQLIMRRVSYVL